MSKEKVIDRVPISAKEKVVYDNYIAISNQWLDLYDGNNHEHRLAKQLIDSLDHTVSIIANDEWLDDREIDPLIALDTPLKKDLQLFNSSLNMLKTERVKNILSHLILGMELLANLNEDGVSENEKLLLINEIHLLMHANNLIISAITGETIDSDAFKTCYLHITGVVAQFEKPAKEKLQENHNTQMAWLNVQKNIALSICIAVALIVLFIAVATTVNLITFGGATPLIVAGSLGILMLLQSVNAGIGFIKNVQLWKNKSELLSAQKKEMPLFGLHKHSIFVVDKTKQTEKKGHELMVRKKDI